MYEFERHREREFWLNASGLPQLEALERAVADLAARLRTPTEELGELRQRVHERAALIFNTTGLDAIAAIEQAAEYLLAEEQRRFKDAIFDAVYDLAPAAVMVENFAALSSPPPRKRAGGYTRGLMRRIRRS